RSDNLPRYTQLVRSINDVFDSYYTNTEDYMEGRFDPFCMVNEFPIALSDWETLSLMEQYEWARRAIAQIRVTNRPTPAMTARQVLEQMDVSQKVPNRSP